MTTKEKALPYVLSGIGALGVVATAILAARNTMKYCKSKEHIYYDPRDDKVISKKEYAKLILKNYWPTMITGSLTMASIILSGGMLHKTQVSLAGTTLLLNANRAKLLQYKDKVKDVLGIESHGKVIKEISEEEYAKCVKKINERLKNNEVIYYEEHIGFFIADPDKLEHAMGVTNERIQSVMNTGTTNDDETNHYATLKTLLYDAEAVEANDENNIIDNESYSYGWSEQYLKEAYDDLFIHAKFNEHKNKDDKVDYIILSFDKDPIFDVKKSNEVCKL